MKLLVLLFLIPSISTAELKFPSDRLKVMDIETLQRIVTTNLSGAQKALSDGTDSEGQYSDKGNTYTKEEGAALIRESLELLFARPEQTNATSVIYNNVEGVALEYGGIYGFLEEVTNNGIANLKKSCKSSDKNCLRDQNSYIYILNNLMGEIKPLALAPQGGEMYKKLIEKVRDEDIDFSDELKSYRVLNSMSNITNPSKVAEVIVGKKKCSWYAFLWC